MHNNFQGNAYGNQVPDQMYYNTPMHYPTQSTTLYHEQRPDTMIATDKEKVDFLRRCSPSPLISFLLYHLEYSAEDPQPLVEWTRKHGWEIKIDTKPFAHEWGKQLSKKVTFCRISRTLGLLSRCMVGGYTLLERHEKLGKYRFLGGYHGNSIPNIPEHQLMKVGTCVVGANVPLHRPFFDGNIYPNPEGLHKRPIWKHPNIYRAEDEEVTILPTPPLTPPEKWCPPQFGTYPFHCQGQQPSWPQMNPYGQMESYNGSMGYGTQPTSYPPQASFMFPSFQHSLPSSNMSAPPHNRHSLTPSFTSVVPPNQHSLTSDFSYVSPPNSCSLTSDFSYVSPPNTHSFFPPNFASCSHSLDSSSNHSTPSPSNASLIPSDQSTSSDAECSFTPSSQNSPLPIMEGDVTEFFGLSTPSGSAAEFNQTESTQETPETPEVSILPLEHPPNLFDNSLLDSLLPEELSALFEDSIPESSVSAPYPTSNGDCVDFTSSEIPACLKTGFDFDFSTF